MFWSKKSGEKTKGPELPKRVELGRNDPCHCGSRKKYKKCCMTQDEAIEHKAFEEHFAKSAAAAKEQAEKKAKETPNTPSKPSGTQKSTEQRHPTFIPHQVNMPRRSGGG